MAIDYTSLDLALSMIGANRDTRPLQLSPDGRREKVKAKLKQGVKVEATDFESLETVADMFAHDGEHAFLYIDEPKVSEDFLKEAPAENAQRFHLVKRCSTLLKMHNDGKSERYVLIQNSEGTFPSKPFDYFLGKTNANKKIDAKLLPCKNCLGELAYMGYTKPGSNYMTPQKKAKNRDIFLNFNVKKFFNHYEPFFFDENYYRKNADDGKANYTADHAIKRDQLLEQHDCTCQQCGVQLKDRTDLLHMHHVNSRRGDNDDKNLELLCILCHALRPMHAHMKSLIKPAHIAFIERRRARRNK